MSSWKMQNPINYLHSAEITDSVKEQFRFSYPLLTGQKKERLSISKEGVHKTRMSGHVLRLLILLLLLLQLMKGLRACLTNNKNQLKNRQRCFKNGQKKQARSSQTVGEKKKKKSTGNKISRVNQHKQMKLKKRFKNQRKGGGQQMLQRKKKMKCWPRRGRTGNKRQVQTNP